jgi:8-oxo-dGTP diphosphatase
MPWHNQREYPSLPIVGVGGVVIFEGNVLLIRRGKEPSKGAWSIPGGQLELGESLREGVRRELAEESSLEIKVLGLIDVFETVSLDPESRVQHHFVVLDYLCEKISGEPKAGSDVTDVAWVAESELGRFALTSDLIEVIHKAFRMARAVRT